jgi:protein O-mannosyl-transferase
VTLEHRQKHIVILICVGIIAGTFVAYEPIRHNGFVNYDDDRYITENPNVTGGITRTSIVWAFTKPHFFMWHPLTTLSHMLDYQLFGLNPSGHHLVSVLLHIANALLLFWILKNITGAIRHTNGGQVWASAFVAAVFALHPIQVESVAWAAERKTVLSGLFWLLTMAAYIHYSRQPRLSRYLLVLLVFGLCIMTKPVVVTLPLVLLLLDYWPLERIGGPGFAEGLRCGKQRAEGASQKVSAVRLIVEKIPLVAMSAFLSVMTFVAQKGGEAVVSLDIIPLDIRIANVFSSYIKYIGKLIWPSGLAVRYPYPCVTLSNFWVVMCAILLIVLTVVIVCYIGRRKKYAVVGWLWYVGTLVPVIGLVQSGGQAMANRYMYLPMLGLLIIIACAAKDFVANRLRMKIVVAILAAVLLSALVILTRIQVGHWQNSITLYEYTLKVTQNNALAENNYGIALFEAGRFDEAISHFNKALSITPKMAEAEKNLGRAYLEQGKAGDAVACFRKVIENNKTSAEAYSHLGSALYIQKKYDEAIKCFDKALSLDPNYPDARYGMGLALMTTNRFNEAIVCFNEVLRQNGDSAKVHYNLAIALGAQKKYDEAIEHLAKVLQLNPMYPEAHNKIGFALQLAGRPDEAIKYLNEGLKINKDQETYANLGSAYIKVGKYDLAIENLSKAIELKPDNIDVLNKLAWLFAAVDDTSIHNAQKGVEFAQQGCELTGYKDPMLLDTLAVAYAATGRFDEAKATAEKALNIAKEAGWENLATAIQERIKLYKAGQPYREK